MSQGAEVRNCAQRLHCVHAAAILVAATMKVLTVFLLEQVDVLIALCLQSRSSLTSTSVAQLGRY